jgi:hypothetical protein
MPEVIPCAIFTTVAVVRFSVPHYFLSHLASVPHSINC